MADFGTVFGKPVFAGVGVIGIAIFLDLIVIILYGLYIYYSNRTRGENRGRYHKDL